MGDFIFKISGPSRAMEVQVPVSKSISEIDMVRKLVGGQQDEDDNTAKKKKKSSKKSTNDDMTAKIGIGTFGALLASVVLAAMKEDSR